MSHREERHLKSSFTSLQKNLGTMILSIREMRIKKSLSTAALSFLPSFCIFEIINKIKSHTTTAMIYHAIFPVLCSCPQLLSNSLSMLFQEKMTINLMLTLKVKYTLMDHFSKVVIKSCKYIKRLSFSYLSIEIL